MKRQATLFGLTLLAACGGQEPTSAGDPGGNVAASLPAALSTTSFDTPAAQGRNLAVDPAGPQAARETVALYYKAIGNRQFDLAHAFWSAGPMRQEDPDLFASRFAGEEKVRVEVGTPSAAKTGGEFAYVSVPVIVRGAPAMAMDAPYALPRLVLLRRISTGPAASASARYWQIQEVRDPEAGPEGTPRPIAF